MMSFDAPEPLIVPAVRLLGSVALAPDELGLVLLLALPILAFFRTKPPAAVGLVDGLAVLLAPLSRWRQPVAVTCPATSLDGRVVG
jgi:hypothetical protein